MRADVLALCITRASAAMFLTVRDEVFFVFQKGEHALFQCWTII